MPELPEVETIRRGLEKVIRGRKIECVTLMREGLRFPFTSQLKEMLEGEVVEGVGRQGKYLFLNFKGTLPSLLIHLGMSGKIRIVHPSAEKLPHTHVEIRFDHDLTLHYVDPRRFGFMRLMAVKGEGLENLGPEPLDSKWSPTYLYEKIQNKKAPIKSVLLDQSVVAGLGNIYVLEALFRSRISPLRSANCLSLSECEDLWSSIRAVLMEAIEQGGSTLKDYKGIYGDGGYFQHRFSVYNKKNMLCERCKASTIHCIRQSGRASYFCKTCQL